MKKRPSAYTASGVDIDANMSALAAVKKQVKSTRRGSASLSDTGAFGGMFAAPGRDKVLLASTDGVGTKLKVAVMTGRHNTVGQDIVNHCVNDILVHGAEPLFFLDYFGTARFQGRIFKAVMAGLCKACRENQCALIGGETAEMPGVYRKGEYDLVGTIVGAVGRKNIITGKTIRPRDVVIGLPSSGLHTNGFSLARKIVFDKAKLGINHTLPGTRKSVADVLLTVHKSYLKPVRQLKKSVTIRGMAHITGGGFPDNVPRVLPPAVDAVIDRSAWTVPTVFRFLQERGKVDREEMYRVFNMGIGLVIIVRRADEQRAMRILKHAGSKPRVIGRIEKGTGKACLIN
ncbi:phosphoribosylformylglycinamidine cyclo-ligase [Verrucomicrobiota bacterium]